MSSSRIDPTSARFQAGGTLHSTSLYVVRQADSDIYDALLSGEYCYVIAPRQIGKSSLRARTTRRLHRDRQDIQCVTLDLTLVGNNLVGDESSFAVAWYVALIKESATQLKLIPELLATFLKETEDLPPATRWSKFWEYALKELPPDLQVVVFVDEADFTRSLPFCADDFFAAIRGAFNRRSDDPLFERLAFCLIGVTPPMEVVQNPEISPFNIGRAIRLDDFSRDEAEVLTAGLSKISSHPQRLLDAVLSWTAGHPYMSQRICEALVLKEEINSDQRHLDSLVKELFLERGRTDDKSLADTERRFMLLDRGSFDSDVRRMLALYRRLLDEGFLPVTGDDPLHLKLRLTGLVAERKTDSGYILQPRNRIYRAVFDEEWVRQREVPSVLTEQLSLWRENERSIEFLLRGALLKEAEEWARGRNDLTADESDFLRSSRELAQREADERRERELTQERAGFQRISAALSAQLDLAETFRLIIHVTMEIAGSDGGAMYMLPDTFPDDTLILSASHGLHRNSIRRFRHSNLSGAAKIAFKKRRTVTVPDTSTSFGRIFPKLRSITGGNQEVETRSVICIPVMVGDRPVGLLELYAREPREYPRKDIMLLSSYALLAAVAIENARLYAQERGISQTLQRAFLPELPGSISGFQVGRIYSPGSEIASVGGDTYDLFSFPDGRIAAVIADVCGQGTVSATLTVMAKYTIRAYALEDPDPSRVLARVNEALIHQTGDSAFLTICYALIDPATRHVKVASAAHPPPLFCRPSENICRPMCDEPGLIVGFLPDQEYKTSEQTFQPGDVMVLYTDGVIEARKRKGMFELERLRKVIIENASLGAQEITTSIFAAVLDYVSGMQTDDMAILALKAE